MRSTHSRSPMTGREMKSRISMGKEERQQSKQSGRSNELTESPRCLFSDYSSTATCSRDTSMTCATDHMRKRASRTIACVSFPRTERGKAVGAAAAAARVAVQVGEPARRIERKRALGTTIAEIERHATPVRRARKIVRQSVSTKLTEETWHLATQARLARKIDRRIVL